MKVVKVEELGYTDVYDLHIDDEDHSFYCEDIPVHNSGICRNLDNVTIYKPVRELPGYFLTPRHFSCRSKLAPHIEDSEDVPFRSSIEGQVANQSYGQWFKTQSPAFQKSVLGTKKYNLYKQGRYQIGGLADIKGKSLSLNQIDDVLKSETFML